MTCTRAFQERSTVARGEGAPVHPCGSSEDSSRRQQGYDEVFAAWARFSRAVVGACINADQRRHARRVTSRISTATFRRSVRALTRVALHVRIGGGWQDRGMGPMGRWENENALGMRMRMRRRNRLNRGSETVQLFTHLSPSSLSFR